MSERAVVAILFVSALAYSTPVLALGILVDSSSATNAKIYASRTIIARTEADVTVQETEIHYLRGDSRFLWLLPVAADGDVQVGECRTQFEEVDAVTRPRILLRRRGYDESDGCGGDRYQTAVISEIGSHDYTGGPVELESPASVLGPFGDLTELRDWLTAQEFTIPNEAGGLLDHYIGYSWRFVAVSVESTVTTGNLCVQLTYSSPADREYTHLLPIKSVSVSADPESEVLIYTLGQGRARPYFNEETRTASYYASEMNYDGIRYVGGDQTNYPELFRAIIESGPAPTFVVEYSGEIADDSILPTAADRWLTRLRIWIAPNQVPDEEDEFGSDLALELLEGPPVDRDYQIVIASVGAAPFTIALFAVAMVGVSWISRRKR